MHLLLQISDVLRQDDQGNTMNKIVQVDDRQRRKIFFIFHTASRLPS